MIRILDLRLFRAELKARMPFKYGIATMTQLPHVFVQARVEIDGVVQDGLSADHLPPKWFTKDPTRDPREEIGDMLRVIHHAMDAARGLAAPTVFATWHDLYRRQSAWGAAEAIPPLLSNFGTSLIERALIDAAARSAGSPFHRLLQTGVLGIDLGVFHPSLAGSQPRDWLPAEPQRRIFARHTVGLSDPLVEADIATTEKLADGLPQSLEACIGAYGLRHFKIKINGQRDSDLARLERIASVLGSAAPADYRHTLDGNEGFASAAHLRAFLAEAAERPILAEFFRRLLFIEQPFHRGIALTQGASLVDWPGHPPVIIDESDAELGSLAQALRLGYAGTSHKNCKGVFKGIANACRVAQLNREQPAGKFVMSGEDLSNIGPVALLQDLAVQAAIGVASVERNGHHYFAGVSFWPPAIQSALLSHHGDLYTRSTREWPRVDIREGEMMLDTVNAAPFGVGFQPEVEAFSSGEFRVSDD